MANWNSGPYRADAWVWPVELGLITLRFGVDTYEARAKDYAVCWFVESLGSHRADIKALRVQALHDELRRANLEVAIA